MIDRSRKGARGEASRGGPNEGDRNGEDPRHLVRPFCLSSKTEKRKSNRKSESPGEEEEERRGTINADAKRSRRVDTEKNDTDAGAEEEKKSGKGFAGASWYEELRPDQKAVVETIARERDEEKDGLRRESAHTEGGSGSSEGAVRTEAVENDVEEGCN